MMHCQVANTNDVDECTHRFVSQVIVIGNVLLRCILYTTSIKQYEFIIADMIPKYIIRPQYNNTTILLVS